MRRGISSISQMVLPTLPPAASMESRDSKLHLKGQDLLRAGCKTEAGGRNAGEHKLTGAGILR